MIIDLLARGERYGALGDRFAWALRYLGGLTAAAPVGTIELDGRRLFVMVQEYRAKAPAEGFWEAHRTYADIQVVLAGRELVGWAPVDDLQAGPYDAEKDLMVLQGPAAMAPGGPGEWLTLAPGRFALFLPQDAHMPGLAIPGAAGGDDSRLRKAVAKIALDGY
ncbi:MAG: DUF386 domain-containing protein [Candidatus Riflebacteria bacterium]|nr:DUF386 domain-containing protein [Candidatus Riflebacteria bacterium]